MQRSLYELTEFWYPAPTNLVHSQPNQSFSGGSSNRDGRGDDTGSVSGSHAMNERKTRAADDVGITVLFRRKRRRSRSGRAAAAAAASEESCDLRGEAQISAVDAQMHMDSRMVCGRKGKEPNLVEDSCSVVQVVLFPKVFPSVRNAQSTRTVVVVTVLGVCFRSDLNAHHACHKRKRILKAVDTKKQNWVQKRALCID